MKREWKTLSTKEVYKNKWIKVFEDEVIMPGGKRGIYGYLTKPPAIFIIAEDENENVYFINEYRYVLKKTILQLPGGVCEDANLIEEARRELFEETGITGKKGKFIGKFYLAPGHESTYANVVLITDLDISKLTTNKQEGDESVESVVKLNQNQIKEKLLNSEIECGISVAALSFYLVAKSKFDKEAL